MNFPDVRTHFTLKCKRIVQIFKYFLFIFTNKVNHPPQFCKDLQHMHFLSLQVWKWVLSLRGF